MGLTEDHTHVPVTCEASLQKFVRMRLKPHECEWAARAGVGSSGESPLRPTAGP